MNIPDRRKGERENDKIMKDPTRSEVLIVFRKVKRIFFFISQHYARHTAVGNAGGNQYLVCFINVGRLRSIADS